MEGKRKKRRRPPRKVVRPLTAEELMAVDEFRRWRYHAPASLKRQAYAGVRKLVRAAGGGGRRAGQDRGRAGGEDMTARRGTAGEAPSGGEKRPETGPLPHRAPA